jgi:D-amino-acid oxidase
MIAYHIWKRLASDPNFSAASGINMKPSYFFFPHPIKEDADQLLKMKEIMASGVIGFRRDRDLIHERRVDLQHGDDDAHEILAPIIDTDVSMEWLMNLIKAKGAELLTEAIQDDLLVLEQDLRQRFSADAIINFTGFAGSQLAGDSTCYPIRGGLIRVLNNGIEFPKVEAALTITAGASGDANNIIFLVPRNEDILVLGGKFPTRNL